MGLDENAFYDPRKVAIVPMGFCYPGRGQGGDAPPRPECAPLWRERILSGLHDVRLTLVIGAHAQRWHLGTPRRSVAQRARDWLEERGEVVALPHPSPRNNVWLKRHPWFEHDVVPNLRRSIDRVLESNE